MQRLKPAKTDILMHATPQDVAPARNGIRTTVAATKTRDTQVQHAFWVRERSEQEKEERTKKKRIERGAGNVANGDTCHDA